MPKGPTIYDIARITGVSVATVSNVLNGKGRVGEKTKERVLAAAREQGYVANFAAKSLSESRTHTVGIVTPDVSNDFFAGMVLHAQERLHELGYTCFICDTRGSAEREETYLVELAQKNVDGVLFVGGMYPLDYSPVPKGMPYVCVDRLCTGGLTVRNDTERMLRDTTTHLLSLGCRRIAYLDTVGVMGAGEERPSYVGYVSALTEEGMALDEGLVLIGPHEQSSHVEAEELISGLIASGVAFDGIACMGDRVALGALRALTVAGINVGTDVRLIGLDNSIYSRLSSPSISSVERHADEMARAGAEALAALIDGGHPGSLIVPHELLPRETTLGR